MKCSYSRGRSTAAQSSAPSSSSSSSSPSRPEAASRLRDLRCHRTSRFLPTAAPAPRPCCVCASSCRGSGSRRGSGAGVGGAGVGVADGCGYTPPLRVRLTAYSEAPNSHSLAAPAGPRRFLPPPTEFRGRRPQPCRWAARRPPACCATGRAPRRPPARGGGRSRGTPRSHFKSATQVQGGTAHALGQHSQPSCSLTRALRQAVPRFSSPCQQHGAAQRCAAAHAQESPALPNPHLRRAVQRGEQRRVSHHVWLHLVLSHLSQHPHGCLRLAALQGGAACGGRRWAGAGGAPARTQARPPRAARSPQCVCACTRPLAACTHPAFDNNKTTARPA